MSTRPDYTKGLDFREGVQRGASVAGCLLAIAVGINLAFGGEFGSAIGLVVAGSLIILGELGASSVRKQRPRSPERQ